MAIKNWIRPGVMLDLVLKHLFRKPATLNYPFEKFEMPDKFRAKLFFESEKCIGCMMCMKDCPSRAIVITKVRDKVFKADIDNGRCIYCSQCVLVCPKNALAATKEYELASVDRQSLKTVFDAKPETAAQPKAE